MSIDLKTLAASPDTSIANTALLFGADSASELTPSVYTVNSVANLFISSVHSWPVNQTFTANVTINVATISTSLTAPTINSVSYTIASAYVANSSGLYHSGTVNAASFTTSGTIANTSGLYPTSNTVGSALGAGARRWELIANSGNFATTLAAGNTTITGFLSVSSNTLSLGSNSSITANGFSRLPNGLLMQWGTVSANSSAGNIAFPTGFTAIYSVTVTGQAGTYDATHVPLLIASNTTTANVRTANATSITTRYMAIGT